MQNSPSLILVLLATGLFQANVSAQNLVPNPSFEEHKTCQFLGIEIDTAIYNPQVLLNWASGTYGGSPDYYNACHIPILTNPTNYSIPLNQNGYQAARSGNAYVGIHQAGVFMNGGNFREYVQTRLQKKLFDGQKYCVGFYANLAMLDSIITNRSIVAIKDWGLQLTRQRLINLQNPSPPSPTNIDAFLLGGIPQIRANDFIRDTMDWVLISGIYEASGGEEWITIGNFAPRDQTPMDTLVVGTWNVSSYYYLDDVFVIPMDDGGLLPRDTTLCQSNLPLQVTAFDGYTNYRWDDGDTIRVKSIAEPGTYTLTADFEGGCPIRDTLRVAAAPPPSIILEPLQFCISELPQPYTADPVLGANAYAWSDGTVGRTVAVEGAGTLTLTATGECGTASGILIISTEAPPLLDIGDLADLCPEGQSKAVVLQNAVPLSNYQWSTGETSAEISITEPGLYRLNHEGSCGLTSDEVFATGCMPRVYLPNVIDLDASDPANQVLLPGVAHGVLTRMEVYDRWGSLVYEESPVSKGWDGRWNGQRCLPGVYVYRVAYRRPEGVEEEWVLGDVTLF